MGRAGRGGGYSGGGGRSFGGGGGSRGSGGRGSFGHGASPGRAGRGMGPPRAPRPASGGRFGSPMGGFGHTPRPRTVVKVGGGWGWGSPWGWGRRRVTHVHHHHHGGGGQGSGGCGGILGIVLLLILILILVVAIVPPNTGGNQVTPSTVSRTPLPAGSAVGQSGFYTDHLGWIRSSTVLETGMRNFFNQTGVWPHLYITDIVSGTTTPSQEEVVAYAQLLYDTIFSDEASLLLLFHESDDMPGFRTGWATGIQASTVLDSEAMDILLDFLDRYYFYDVEEEQFFAMTFNDAANRIMSVTTSPFVAISWAALGVALLGIGFMWWRRIKEQKNLEAEQAQAILNTPISEIGGNPTGLEQKYEE